MSIKKSDENEKLHLKYSKDRVANYVRMRGSLKNKFYADLKRTGFSENKLHLDIIRFYYDNQNKENGKQSK